MDTGKSALGLEGNLAAAIGYPIGIVAIISLVMEKENQFVRFHALQSILLYVAFIALWIAVVVISVILGIIGIAASQAGSAGGAIGSIIGLLWWLVVMVIFLGAFIGMILAAVKAYQGNLYKLPVIGNMAEKWTSK